jgi:polyferredoxin
MEIPVDSWQEILGPQALDLVLMAVFTAVAMVSFFRKSVRLKYATFVMAVGYMGFSKSHLISVVDLFGVIDRNLPIPKYNIGYYLFGVFAIASTVLWGRVYCGRICAFGAMTQLMDAVLPKRLRFEPPPRVERHASRIKYVLLGLVIVYFVATHDMQVYRYVEPFWMFGLFGTVPMWIGLAVLLLATVFVRNLYCRFLCPVGALLGLISNLTVFKIKRWSECKTCKICEKTCEWGAIQGPKIVKSECVRCDDCERLYMDQKKCPHWIIILKKADRLQAQGSGLRA